MERLQTQIAFLLEVDKLKSVFRRNPISRGSPALWDFARGLIEDAAARGYLEG